MFKKALKYLLKKRLNNLEEKLNRNGKIILSLNGNLEVVGKIFLETKFSDLVIQKLNFDYIKNANSFLLNRFIESIMPNKKEILIKFII